MIRNIYILLLLSLPFGTVYGMYVTIQETYSITGQNVGLDTIQYKHPDTNTWVDAFYTSNGWFTTGSFWTDSPAGTVVELRLQSECCGELTTGTCTGDNCMGENPPSVGTQDDFLEGAISVHLTFTYSPEYILGDINGDGYLDVLDVVIIIDIVLVDGYNEIGDINEDAILNILDIIVLVNIILNT